MDHFRFRQFIGKYCQKARVEEIMKMVSHLSVSLSIALLASEVLAFDLDAGIKAATEPAKKMINDYYPVAIFISGAIGAMMQQQGDLRERMLGFGKGSLIGGLTVIAVKAGLGV